LTHVGNSALLHGHPWASGGPALASNRFDRGRDDIDPARVARLGIRRLEPVRQFTEWSRTNWIFPALWRPEPDGQ
jgi:hypothetical protein